MKFKDWTTGVIELALVSVLTVTSCSTVPKTIADTGSHLAIDSQSASQYIPEPVTTLPTPPPPVFASKQLYSVVVVNVPLNEVLFSIARDSGINFDIHSGVKGNITINAVDQTLVQLLDRIERQANIRYTINEDLVSVKPDTPYLKSYDIDYPNMARSSQSIVSIATEVASTGGSGDSDSDGGNVSSTAINNVSNNDFWTRIGRNIEAILRGGDSLISNEGGSSDSSDNSSNNSSGKDDISIIANPESGIITIRASHKQHVEIQRYLDTTIEHALRQVLIEATIVEVTLNDEYQAGVDWSKFASGGEGFSVNQSFLAGALGSAPSFEVSYNNTVNGLLDFSSSVRALDIFGKTKVLSSPRLMVLNNQTALLKVVDNRVYFTVEIETDTPDNGIPTRFFETEVHTVPVGFVMSVTPQISSTDAVTLHARPTVSRILRFVNDPNPEIAAAGIQNKIPEIQVREMESILKIQSGNIGIIGGLMQDTVSDQSEGIPILARIPGIGGLFSYKNDKSNKSELVIFIRPIVVKQASIKQDLHAYSQYIED